MNYRRLGDAGMKVSAVVTGFTLTALLSSRLAGIPVVAEHAGSYLPPVFERFHHSISNRTCQACGTVAPAR